MPNVLDANGLQTSTQAELITYFSNQFQFIYGVDINLDPNTPDGQWMMILIQSILDLEDFVTQVYSSMDPDNAIGATLDQRVALNGIQRQGGTKTITNVSITTDRALNLFGTDQNLQPIYTVADNAGNQWQLITSLSIGGAGTQALSFAATNPGAVQTVPNTITVPVTIILGVTAINNPTTFSSLGENEESNVALKIRRQKSTALSSQGYLQGLLAALLNIPGMASAFIYENITGSTNADGVPSHSIWVIVSGTATPAAIANAIYTKRNAGCGMKGAQTYTIAQADGSSFLVHWDNVSPEALFIKFTATSLDGVNAPNIAAIRAGLVTSFVPGVAQTVNINALAAAVQAIDPNTLVTAAGFSTTSGGSYTSTLATAAKSDQFAVTAPDIIILPIIAVPSSGAVPVSTTAAITFSALGGFGAYTWSMHTNVSGGSVGSSSGIYNSGATPGTDVVRVTDAAGNLTDVNVVVS